MQQSRSCTDTESFQKTFPALPRPRSRSARPPRTFSPAPTSPARDAAARAAGRVAPCSFPSPPSRSPRSVRARAVLASSRSPSRRRASRRARRRRRDRRVATRIIIVARRAGRADVDDARPERARTMSSTRLRLASIERVDTRRRARCRATWRTTDTRYGPRSGTRRRRRGERTASRRCCDKTW